MTTFTTHFPQSPDSTSSSPDCEDTPSRSSSPPRSTHRAVLTKAQAIEIYLFAHAVREAGADPLQGGISAKLAKEYGVSPKAIRDIWNRRTWTQETRHLWAAHEQPMMRYKKLPAPACLAAVVAGSGYEERGFMGCDGLQKPAYCSFFSPRCASFAEVSWCAIRDGCAVRDGGRGHASAADSGCFTCAAAQLACSYFAAPPPPPRFPEYMGRADGWGAAGGGRGGQHGEALGYFRAGAGAGAAGAEWDGPTGLLPVDAAGDSDPFHADWPHW